jgi:aldose 1-epimerase
VTSPSGEQFELVAAGRCVVVVEVGGGIREWEGVLLGYGADEMCHSGLGQALAPWPNRLAEGRYEWEGEELQLPLTEVSTGSAIHGLVRWAAWQAVEVEPSRVVMAHTLHPQPGYPFTLRLRIEYRLSERGLHVRSSAENAGSGAAPFGMGHHPYVLGPSDELVLDGEPVGSRQLDETRHRPGGWRTDLGRAAVWADEAWPWQQIFTGDLPDVRRGGLAVEPMTCPPQAFRTGEGVIRLEPGESWSGEWGIDVS